MSRITDFVKLRKNSLPWFISLASIIVIGISLRWIFGAELVFEIPLRTAKASSSIACVLSGQCEFLEFAEIRAWIGIKGILLFFPTAVLYLLLGVGRISTSLYPLSVSLLAGFLYYRIAKELFGPGAGLIAFLFWAFNPVEIFGARLLLEESILQAVLLGLACSFILLLKNPKVIPSLILVSTFGILFYFNFAIGLQTSLVLISYLSFRKLKAEQAWWLTVLLILAMASTLLMVSNPFSSYLSIITRTDSLIWLPLLFMATSVLLVKGVAKIELQFVFAWLLTSFLLVLFQDSCNLLSLSCTTDLFNGLGPMKLFFMVPPMILIFSAYLGKNTESLNFRSAGMIALGTIVLTLLSVEIRYGSHRLIEDLSPLIINAKNILVYSRIALAGLLVMVLASPLFSKQRKQGLRQTFVFAFAFLFGFASLYIFEVNSEQANFEWNATKTLLTEIKHQSTVLPIVVPHEKDQLLFQYIEGFGLNQKLSSTRIVPEDLGNIRDAFLIIMGDQAEFAFTNKWGLVDQVFNNNGSGVAVYRTLSIEEAKKLESIARGEIENKAGDIGYYDFYSSLINQGRICEALNLWIENPLFFQKSRYLDVSYVEDCSDLRYVTILSSEDQGIKDMFFRGINGSVKEVTEGGVHFHFFLSDIPYYPDWRSYDISLVLKPDRIYRLSARVRANNPVIALYLANKEQEWFVPQNKYEEWTTIEVLFSTYGLQGEDLHVHFSPFMIGPYQQVNFTRFDLQELIQ